MDIGSLFLILALAVLVFVFVTRPLFEGSSVSVSEDERTISALLAERERILTALQELDFDHSLGKIPEDIYPLQRESLLQRGAETLRQLDAVQAGVPSGGGDAQMEEAIAERRAKRTPTGEEDALEVMIASRREAREGKQAGFCPQCGASAQAGDRFCSRCGTSLN